MTCDRSVVFSTDKTDHHDITEILWAAALNTINPTKPNQAKPMAGLGFINRFKIVFAKTGPDFLSAYVVGFFVFSDLRGEVIVIIRFVDIVLSFLFIKV